MSAGIDIKRLDDIESAKVMAGSFSHSIVYQISETLIDNPAEKIKWDEVTEAFFFDTQKELHFFCEDGELVCVQAVEIDGADAHVVSHSYAINGHSGKLIVREYLDFDEDGQMFVAYTRLVDIR